LIDIFLILAPRKLRENIRELKTLKSQFKELKVSTQMLRTEVEVYQTISNQLRRFLPSRTKSELNQPIEYVYELLSMVGDLTEKRRIIEEHESAKNGNTRLKRVISAFIISLNVTNVVNNTCFGYPLTAILFS